eukprot:1773031-Amphidinium_carterae.1
MGEKLGKGFWGSQGYVHVLLLALILPHHAADVVAQPQCQQRACAHKKGSPDLSTKKEVEKHRLAATQRLSKTSRQK